VSYPSPGFAQLATTCPAQIREGGTEGSEMGVFHDLAQPWREQLLLTEGADHLPFGVDLRISFKT
jgi:hypothetical protein